VRRSVLLETQQIQQLQAQAICQGSVCEQLAEMARASTVIAPHGAAMANLIAAAPGTEVLELVNPAYQPSYFDGLIQRRQLRHRRLEAATTPLPLQEWLYEGPLSFPIDLRPGASAAAEALASWAS
jgi:capsular polysaccharide biosynthesis protein